MFMEDVQFDYERRFSLFPLHSLYIFTPVYEQGAVEMCIRTQ